MSQCECMVFEFGSRKVAAGMKEVAVKWVMNFFFGDQCHFALRHMSFKDRMINWFLA